MSAKRLLVFVGLAFVAGCFGVSEKRASSRGNNVKATLRSGTSLCLPAWGCDHVQSLTINGVETTATCATGSTDLFLRVEENGARLLYECGAGNQVVYVEGTAYFHGCAQIASRDWNAIPSFVSGYPDLLPCNDKQAVVRALAARGVPGATVVQELLRREDKDRWAWSDIYYELRDPDRSALGEDLRARAMASMTAGDAVAFERYLRALLEPQQSRVRDELLTRFAANASTAAYVTMVRDAVHGATAAYADRVIDVVQGLGASLPEDAASLVAELHRARPNDPRVRNIACANLARFGATAFDVLAATPGPRCADLEHELRKKAAFACEHAELLDRMLGNNGGESALFTMLRKRRAYALEEAASLPCENEELPRGTKCHCRITYCQSVLSAETTSCKFVVDDARKTIRSLKR